jgi:hypothetical protein
LDVFRWLWVSNFTIHATSTSMTIILRLNNSYFKFDILILRKYQKISIWNMDRRPNLIQRHWCLTVWIQIRQPYWWLEFLNILFVPCKIMLHKLLLKFMLILYLYKEKFFDKIEKKSEGDMILFRREECYISVWNTKYYYSLCNMQAFKTKVCSRMPF